MLFSLDFNSLSTISVFSFALPPAASSNLSPTFPLLPLRLLFTFDSYPMAKDKKEKKESKMDKKSLLKVKSKNKFKKKSTVNEASGINDATRENEHNPVIIEGKKAGKGEKNPLAKTIKKKLKERVNKISESSVQVNDEDKIPSENEELIMLGKEKKKRKKETNKKNDIKLTKKKKKSKESIEEIQEKAEEISKLNDDSSKGIKKWLEEYKTEYKNNGPDRKIILQKIDDFVLAHHVKLEQEKKEREEKEAEDGWTVVTHNKGRKKSTDPESGISFGAVSEAKVLDNMSKKKNKEIHLDFYLNQRRDARRNEIMELQREFEKDKKRVQELKAARRFRPC